ncbi:MAG: DUF6655 family protein [Planctomycetaceae bacterium]
MDHLPKTLRYPSPMSRMILRCRGPICGLMLLILSGCGKMIAREATSQLLVSDSVDRAVAAIDFSELSGKKVYFDTEFLKPVKEIGFVNSPYVIGSIRQQMIASGCLLQDKKDDAELIVEGRIGALGTDQHEVIYGVPANNLLNAASNVVTTLPPLPTVPEISLAKKDDQMAAAKIALIAYDQKTRMAVWQSGISQARSTARSEWVLGAGPFQRGTIHRNPRFAGSKMGLNLPLVQTYEDFDTIRTQPYFNEKVFARAGTSQSGPSDKAGTTPGNQAEAASGVVPAGAEVPAPTAEKPPEVMNPPADAKPIPTNAADKSVTDASSTSASGSASVKANVAADAVSAADAEQNRAEHQRTSNSILESELKVKSPFEKIWLFPPRATPQ